MSEVKVNKISPRANCGTVTLGDSGDTITIPAGVTITNNGTQTGFGREGSVNWQTSIKTGDFTAVSGEGYFINTTSGAVVMTLPASPSVGDIVAFKDYAGTFQTNNLTINRNSSNIIGGTNNPVIVVEGQAGTLVYGDATQGWQIVEAATDSDLPRPAFVTATGGTITTSGNFKIHTFTGPGTFCVSSAGNADGSNTVDYLVIAGGGSGGGGDNGVRGGGGGAGGYRESSGAASGCYTRSPLGACVSALPVSVQGYPITVGGGGPQPGPHTPINSAQGSGNRGSNSVFSTITSTGGGGGNTLSGDGCTSGPGGSGGGGGSADPPPERAAGSGNTPPVSPPQGKDGGSGTPYLGSPLASAGGGGGGASAVGGNGNGGPGAGIGGDGGDGVSSSITGSPVARAGGGGGGSCTTTSSGCGGAGGGGRGGRSCGSSGNDAGVAGTANTGGGGGGGSSRMNAAPSNPNVPGSAGGSGIVIIRYKFQ